MAKLQDGVESLFSPFNAAIGNPDKFKRVCNQTASMLGKIELNTEEGEWRAAWNGKVTQGSKTKGVLPMNNPAARLFVIAKRLQEVTVNGEFVVNASIPKTCKDWIDHILDKKSADMIEQEQKA